MTAKKSTKYITRVGLLSAAAFALTLIGFPLPPFPPFLKLEVSSVASLIGGFALGPAASVIIELLKNVLNFIFKNDGTGGVGNLSNFIVSIAFVLPAVFIYHHKKTRKNALIGMAVGTVVSIVAAMLSNVYLIIPAYMKVFGLDSEGLIAMLSAANKNITDLATYAFYAVAPFNLIKLILICLIAWLLYKRVSRPLHIEDKD